MLPVTEISMGTTRPSKMNLYPRDKNSDHSQVLDLAELASCVTACAGMNAVHRTLYPRQTGQTKATQRAPISYRLTCAGRSTGISTSKLVKLQWPISSSSIAGGGSSPVFQSTITCPHEPHSKALSLRLSSPARGWQAALIAALQLPISGMPARYLRNPFAILQPKTTVPTQMAVRSARGE